MLGTNHVGVVSCVFGYLLTASERLVRFGGLVS